MAKLVGVSLMSKILEEQGRIHLKEFFEVLKSTGRLPADPNRLRYWDVNVHNNLQLKSVFVRVPSIKHAGMLRHDVAVFLFQDLLVDAFPDVEILDAMAATGAQNLGWLARLFKIYKGCRELSELADDYIEPEELDHDGEIQMRDNRDVYEILNLI